jgi:hypothetical protein
MGVQGLFSSPRLDGGAKSRAGARIEKRTSLDKESLFKRLYLLRFVGRLCSAVLLDKPYFYTTPPQKKRISANLSKHTMEKCPPRQPFKTHNRKSASPPTFQTAQRKKCPPCQSFKTHNRKSAYPPTFQAAQQGV